MEEHTPDKNGVSGLEGKRAGEDSGTESDPPEKVGSPTGSGLSRTEPPLQGKPTYLFFGVVAAAALLADVLTKAWADIVFTRDAAIDPIEVIKHHLSFTLAYNKGGAWGLLQDANEAIRRPFFLLVSVVAIAFIVSLYGKLTKEQRALKWGLPLVLGGALGNLADRVTRVGVVDFIDYRADWVATMNRWIAVVSKKLGLHDNWTVTDHWPTFNVADIAICIGVGLMALDMLGPKQDVARSEASDDEAPPSNPAPNARDSVPATKVAAGVTEGARASDTA